MTSFVAALLFSTYLGGSDRELGFGIGTGVGANLGARGVSKAPGFDPLISATQAPDSTHLDSVHLGGVGTPSAQGSSLDNYICYSSKSDFLILSTVFASCRSGCALVAFLGHEMSRFAASSKSALATALLPEHPVPGASRSTIPHPNSRFLVRIGPLGCAQMGLGIIRKQQVVSSTLTAGSNKSRPCVILYDLLAVPVAYTLRPAVSVRVVHAGQVYLISK